MKSVTARNVR